MNAPVLQKHEKRPRRRKALPPILKESDLSHAELVRKLIYVPDTGIFTWRNDDLPIHAGSVAGTDNGRGHLRICIRGYRFYAHRLAWFYVTGRWPTAQIDHENRARGDNRFCNLREAQPAQNTMNSKTRTDNTTGVRGVWPSRGQYAAQVQAFGRKFYLGRFTTIDAAKGAVEAMRAQLFMEFAP